MELPSWKLPFKEGNLLTKTGILKRSSNVTQGIRNKYYQASIHAKHPKVTLLSDALRVLDMHTLYCEVCKHTWEANLSNICQSSVTAKSNGCPKCAGNIQLTTLEVVRRLHEEHPGNIELVGNYVGSIKKKQALKCISCTYEWTARLSDILGSRKSGCPSCVNQDCDVVYLWQLGDSSIYKLGITSERLGLSRIKAVAKARGVPYTLVTYTKVANARGTEAYLLSKLTKYRHITKDKLDGYTELLELTPPLAAELAEFIEK